MTTGVLVGACARAGDGDGATLSIDAGGTSNGQDSGVAVTSTGSSSGNTPPPASSSGDDDSSVTGDVSEPVTGDDGSVVVPTGGDDATAGDDASGGDASASCADTCANGCCDPTGTCVTGTEDGACGTGGVACQNCSSAGLTCQSNACFQPPGRDSGGGGSTCNASSCPSCIPYFVPCCKSNDKCGCSLLFPPGACN